MLDFRRTGSSNKSVSQELNDLVDAAVKAKRDADPPRPYLGGSRLGEECLRRLGYEWHNLRAGKKEFFSGRLYRIFARGNDCEKRVAADLRAAGFKLETAHADGEQFGFAVARDPDSGKPRIAGHMDGFLIDGPPSLGGVPLVYPGLWECKGINNKSFGKFMSKAVKKTSPTYYGQMQIYMAYANLKWSLFTAENQDTCEIYAEIVPFVLSDAQATSDKGVRVVSSSKPDELPRCTSDPTDFRCSWCPYKETCWAVPESTGPAQKPSWLSAA